MCWCLERFLACPALLPDSYYHTLADDSVTGSAVKHVLLLCTNSTSALPNASLVDSWNMDHVGSGKWLHCIEVKLQLQEPSITKGDDDEDYIPEGRKNASTTNKAASRCPVLSCHVVYMHPNVLDVLRLEAKPF